VEGWSFGDVIALEDNYSLEVISQHSSRHHSCYAAADYDGIFTEIRSHMLPLIGVPSSSNAT
jgi:hypothetical protein